MTKLDRSFDRITAAATSLAEADTVAAEAAHRPREASSMTLPLDAILPRQENLRPLHEDHVRLIAANIATVGLISPPAVDSAGRLLAGEHRREALLLLRRVSGNLAAAQQVFAKELGIKGGLTHEDMQHVIDAWTREGFDRGVPVRRMANAEGPRALAVEISENTQREDFSNEEVFAVYTKLQKAGYKAGIGRPKHGEKAIMPAMALIFGKHARTVQRALQKVGANERPAPPKTLQALKGLQKAIAKFGPDLPRDNELKAALRLLEEAVEAALEKREEK